MGFKVEAGESLAHLLEARMGYRKVIDLHSRRTLAIIHMIPLAGLIREVASNPGV